MDGGKATAWNVGKEGQRDEDIKIEVPGQEEEVKEVPPAEEEDRGRRRFDIRAKDSREDGQEVIECDEKNNLFKGNFYLGIAHVRRTEMMFFELPKG